MTPKDLKRAIIVAAGFGLALLAYASLFQVKETQLAVVLEFGEPIASHSTPGLKLKSRPWQNVLYFDRRVLNLDVPPREVITSDQKRLIVDAFARYRIVNPLLVYQRVTNEAGVTQQLATVTQSQLREVLARQTFTALLSSERVGLMREIRDRVNQAAQSIGVEIVDVRIKRTDLPAANSDAIYRRMQTERQREAAEIRARGEEQALGVRADADRDRLILLAEANRQADISRGEGDGEAAAIFAKAFGKDEEFFAFYRSMQAYRAALGKNDTTLILSPDNPFFRYLGGEKSAPRR